MKPQDRVNRIQEQQPTAATVLEVRWDTVLIEYEEGGQGWWPISCLEIIDNTNWPQFKSFALTHPGLNAAMAAALPLAPAAALALPAALMRAEQGATADFAGCWRAVCAAANPAPEVLAELVAAAQAANLPTEFVAALSPERERARDEQGRFIADDPATPEDEAWVLPD
jgi:hypothetical protein